MLQPDQLRDQAIERKISASGAPAINRLGSPESAGTSQTSDVPGMYPRTSARVDPSGDHANCAAWKAPNVDSPGPLSSRRKRTVFVPSRSMTDSAICGPVLSDASRRPSGAHRGHVSGDGSIGMRMAAPLGAAAAAFPVSTMFQGLPSGRDSTVSMCARLAPSGEKTGQICSPVARPVPDDVDVAADVVGDPSVRRAAGEMKGWRAQRACGRDRTDQAGRREEREGQTPPKSRRTSQPVPEESLGHMALLVDVGDALEHAREGLLGRPRRSRLAEPVADASVEILRSGHAGTSSGRVERVSASMAARSASIA